MPATPENESNSKPPQQWWYRSQTSVIEGPVSTQAFLSLFSNGYVDGLTTIASDLTVPDSDWLPLSEHPYLREAARTADSPFNHTHVECQPPAPPPPNVKTAEERERKRLSRKRARKAAKLRNRQNTSIYVTGVPADATEIQLASFFSKCGIILPNPESGRPRVKLYLDHLGNPKGDALITYALRPSVENALAILDGTPFRDASQPLSVTEATFHHKRNQQEEPASDDQSKRPRVPIRGRDLVEEALTWSEDREHQKNTPRIVILRNVFHPNSAEYDTIREDMEEGCEQCGQVEKLTIFERNTEGAVAVKFETVEASLKCIDVMNGRWYDGRKLQAAFYDGMTDYTHKETEEERTERERSWEEWLASDRSEPN